MSDMKTQIAFGSDDDLGKTEPSSVLTSPFNTLSKDSSMHSLTPSLKHYSKDSIMHPSLYSHLGNPTLLPDKVSIVFNPEPYEMDYLRSELPNLPGYRDNSYTGYGNYNHRVSVQVKAVGSRSSKLLIELDPKVKFKGASSLRVDWNPSTANMPKVISILDSLLQNGYNRLIVNGSITRFDLACDIPGFNINSFLYYRPRTKSKRPANKRFLETKYIGSSRSAVQFCIYNKNWEQFKHYAITPRYSHLTRIEARLKGHFTIDTLQDKLIKSFETLFITPYSPNGTPGNVQSFLDKCHEDGVSYSLKALTPYQRSKKIKQLSITSLADLLGNRLSTGIGEVVNSVLFPSINVI
jgi:hypothetical protein